MNSRVCLFTALSGVLLLVSGCSPKEPNDTELADALASSLQKIWSEDQNAKVEKPEFDALQKVKCEQAEENRSVFDCEFTILNNGQTITYKGPFTRDENGVVTTDSVNVVPVKDGGGVKP